MVSEMHLLKVLVLQLRYSVRNVYLNDKFVKDGRQGRLGFIYIYKYVYFDISTSTFAYQLATLLKTVFFECIEVCS